MYKTTLLKVIVSSIFLACYGSCFSQVGIGTISPSGGALLDISSSDKGLLIPRVDISNLNTISPITGGNTSSLLVYNTNTTTGEGFHYWNGGQWIPILSGGFNNLYTVDGTLAGNRIITQGTNTLNFTTQSDPNTLFIDGANDNIGVGISPADVNAKFESYSGSGSTRSAIIGRGDNVGGTLGRESGFSFGNPVQSILGAGIYAENPFSGYASIFSQTTGAADVAAIGLYSDVWIGSYSYVDSQTSTLNPPAAYAQLNILDATIGGIKAGTRSLAIKGTLANSGGIVAGYDGFASAQNESVVGINFINFSDADLTGGFLSGGRYINSSHGGFPLSQTFTGLYFGVTDYKVLGTGTVSTIVRDKQERYRVMYAPEAPEVLFQDYGVGQLVNGQARLNIDPVLAKNIHVDVKHPLKVFIQLEGDCNGVYVTDKSKDGFTVKELQGGTSSINFSWQLVATRADTKNASGKVISKFQDLRFPVVPENILASPKDLDREKKKADFSSKKQ